MKRTIIEIVVVLLFIGYIIITKPKPVNDSIAEETKKLHDKNLQLNNKLGDLNQKTKKLKEQHEKDIAHLNSLSDNDVADLFAKEFAELK